MEDASSCTQSNANKRGRPNIQADNLFRLSRAEQNHGLIWRKEATEEGQKGAEVRRSGHPTRLCVPPQTVVSYA